AHPDRTVATLGSHPIKSPNPESGCVIYASTRVRAHRLTPSQLPQPEGLISRSRWSRRGSGRGYRNQREKKSPHPHAVPEGCHFSPQLLAYWLLATRVTHPEYDGLVAVWTIYRLAGAMS